jgi:nucleoside-diphosphate-sugar epimerase
MDGVMSRPLPSLLVTGASGFVGRNFLAALADDYRIFALARRSQADAGVAAHPNIDWIQVDITDWARLKAVMRRVKELGGVDGVLHLAAYYDFSNRDRPEYWQTNVNGTRHILEMAKWLCVKRFVFTSSVAACRFPPPGTVINERSTADADFPYARSKLAGETMTKQYSCWFPCSVVRLAAVFSDWCEYRPLYEFLRTWLSRRWNARILAGRGASAVSYIHVADVNRLLATIFSSSHTLPIFDVYVASPAGATSHQQLFAAATRCYFGHEHRPRFLPRRVVGPGIVVRNAFVRLSGRVPFERPWMTSYVDQRLAVDSSYTQAALSWRPSDRLGMVRRMLHLVANLERDPERWHFVNRTVSTCEVDRSNLAISNVLDEVGGSVVARASERLQFESRRSHGRHVGTIADHDLRRYLAGVVTALVAAVRSGDREFLLPHIDKLVHLPFACGCRPDDVREAFEVLGETAVEEMVTRPGASRRRKKIYDSVMLTLRLAADEIEDSYSRFVQKKRSPAAPAAETAESRSRIAELERFAAQLNAFYEFGEEDREAHAPRQDGDPRSARAARR